MQPAPQIAAATLPPSAPVVTPRLYTMARQALKASGNDTAAAVQSLLEQFLDDKRTLQTVLQDVITIAARSMVNAAIAAQRQSIIRKVEDVTAGRARVLALARGNLGIMDFPLAGGVRLAEADRDKVAEQASLYGMHAADMAHKARWLNAIARRLPAGKTVAAVLTEDEVSRLFMEAQNG